MAVVADAVDVDVDGAPMIVRLVVLPLFAEVSSVSLDGEGVFLAEDEFASVEDKAAVKPGSPVDARSASVACVGGERNSVSSRECFLAARPTRENSVSDARCCCLGAAADDDVAVVVTAEAFTVVESLGMDFRDADEVLDMTSAETCFDKRCCAADEDDVAVSKLS